MSVDPGWAQTLRVRPVISLVCALVLLGSLTGNAAAHAPAPRAPAHPAVHPDAGARGLRGGASGRGDRNDGTDDPTADQSQPTGSVNPLAIRNPFCDESLASAERHNCQVTGTPEGRYPTSNYGFDIHIDTGLDNIVGNFQALLAQIANAIWQACLFVLDLVMTLLGWAFGLTPFSDNETMASIDRGLEGFYSAFTEPWLIVAMVAIGAWGLWRGVVRREVSASIASTLLSLALMLLALWILHEPSATVGRVSQFANDAALTVLAAPQGGTSDPRASYAAATADVWNQVTIPGFAALNFSDPDWALSKPDPDLLATADKYVCVDAAYLSQIPPGRWAELQAANGNTELSCDQLAASLPAPRTNAEMYLRSSPGSLARDKLWDEHTDDPPYSSYFAIQGDGGAWARLPLVVVIALGLLGGICLLSWLALRLLVQTAVAFVLVLMTPLALFMPAFGERGRAAFALWGGTLAGALISKLVYAALLSVVLFATTVITTLVDDVGAMVAFLVTAGIWWAVFLRRDALVSFISVSRDSDGGAGASSWRSRLLGLEASAALGRRFAAPFTRAASGGARAAHSAAVTVANDRSQAGRRVANRGLDERAKARLDSRLASEQEVLAAQGRRRDQVRSLGRERVEALRMAGREKRAAAKATSPAERERHSAMRAKALDRASGLAERQAKLRESVSSAARREASARAFVSDAAEREKRRSQRWSAKDLADAREAIRSESDRPITDSAHAWRVGMSPERYAALRGAERERVYGEVGEQLRTDRAAIGVIPNRPDGIVEPKGERRWRAELRRQPGGEQMLRDARRQVAHRRRQRRRMPDRRGVSR
jgi:hypothetical protein